MLSDTIASIATPRGEGGIGIVRVSGTRAIEIACKLFQPTCQISPALLQTHTLNHGYIVDANSVDVVDEAMLGIMRAPRSYTREDVVEFNCHGGIVPLRRVLELTLRAGARLAEPGEFTKRAFLNGRIDLVQAEAVADLIRSQTDLSRQVAVSQLTGRLSQAINSLNDRIANLLAEVEASVDFPDEDLDFLTVESMRETAEAVQNDLERLIQTASDGHLLREGIRVAILGKPNVGKSSLLNALLQTDRAIVTDIPGTTRDTIEESLQLDGIPIHLIDTAGIRQTTDTVEQHGVNRSQTYLDRADLVLMMFDASQLLEAIDHELLAESNRRHVILILNKIDLPVVASPTDLLLHAPAKQVVQTSLLHGKGLETLKSAVLQEVLGGEIDASESVIVTNVRHLDALRRSRVALGYAIDSFNQGVPPDLIAVDLRDSLDCLGEIVGKTTTEDILDRIFSQFCIGK